MVKINGELKNVDGMKITEYLATTNYNKQRIAVECNGKIVPKKEYDVYVFKDGDSVEIVGFVGGG